MAKHRPLLQGQIYWIDDCPPLDGDDEKRRPVIVVSPSDLLSGGEDPVLVVAVTTGSANDPHRVELPNEETHPGTSTGLPRRSRALPRWLVPVPRRRLIEPAGTLPGVTLERLLEALIECAEYEDDVEDGAGPSNRRAPADDAGS